MLDNLLRSLERNSFSPTLYEVVGSFLIVACIMIPIERTLSRHTTSASENNLNIIYWFFNPLCIRPFTNLGLASALAALSFVLGTDSNQAFFHGFGPIPNQPRWLQILELLLIADLIEYWVHRTFHLSRFWRFHAIHHSAKRMNWLASARMHPLNDLVTRICQIFPLLLLGFPLQNAAIVIPFLFFYVVFLHSDIDWRFGPLAYVIVTPAYHHWHHSSESAAIDKNFAGLFPIWDMIFGTFYLPRHCASSYGVKGEELPSSFIGQMLYPFNCSKISGVETREKNYREMLHSQRNLHNLN
ncbi:MAG: sterol desaturase family protein [Bdellovibrionales bacterium]|nr:sterol desaturase family protein [Bdellovibrionales bacterium]